MYLGLLNEEQKELCIGLAINLASIDGNFSDEEKTMIDAYCYEMGISYDYSKEIAEISDIVERLHVISDMREKKIIVFEAIGLAMADNDFHEKERIMIRTMVEKFNMEESYIDKCEHVIEEYTQFQTRINSLVIG